MLEENWFSELYYFHKLCNKQSTNTNEYSPPSTKKLLDIKETIKNLLKLRLPGSNWNPTRGLNQTEAGPLRMAMQFVHLTTPESSVHVLCPVNSTPWACAIWQPWMDAYLKQKSPDRSCRAQEMGPQSLRTWADSSFLLSSSGCAGPWSLWPKT